jgi:cytochrome c-type biogenesis protein CcmH
MIKVSLLWLPPLARAAGILTFFLLSFALATQVELEPRVFEIADKLRCPVCVSESVAQSSSPTAEQMREIIAEQLRAGEGEADILAYFQARYGDWILFEPPRRGIYWIVWLGPMLAGLLALTLLIYYVRSWHRRAEEPVEAEPAYLAQVRQRLAQDADPGGRR